MKPKLLFLGCNDDQLPYLKAAQTRGYFVVGTDINADAPGATLVDSFYQVGYEDEIELIAVGKNEGFTANDKVFTAASQFAYLGAAAFAEHFRISFISHATVLACLDKTKLYPLFEKYGLSVPPWKEITDVAILPTLVQKWGGLFLKSDFGKSPHYCWRLGPTSHLSQFPAHDRYFRRVFVAQQEIVGEHYRVNRAGGVLYTFYKQSDTVSTPLPEFAFASEVHANVARMLEHLGLASHLVKFDIIVADGTTYFIDIGLEPPLRLNQYVTDAGYIFAELYLDHLLDYNPHYPPLCA